MEHENFLQNDFSEDYHPSDNAWQFQEAESWYPTEQGFSYPNDEFPQMKEIKQEPFDLFQSEDIPPLGELHTSGAEEAQSPIDSSSELSTLSPPSYAEPQEFHQPVLQFNSAAPIPVASTTVAPPSKRKASSSSATEEAAPAKPRRKVESSYIEDNRKRSMCLTKRKKSLMNKASEISDLTGAEVLLVIAINNRVYRHYCNPMNHNFIIPNLQSTLLSAPASSEQPTKLETGPVQYQHAQVPSFNPNYQQRVMQMQQKESASKQTENL